MAKQLQYRTRPALGEPETSWEIYDSARTFKKDWAKKVYAPKYAGETEYRVIEVSAQSLRTAAVRS